MTHSAVKSPQQGFLAQCSYWLGTTNHKDLGALYLVLSLLMFLLGGFLALLMRVELYHPGQQWVDHQTYNQLVTLHGLVMIFGAIMPALTGLANYQIPLMIGAPDMALPRVNNWSFWLLCFGLLLLLATLVLPGPAPDFGWTAYPPLSTTYGPPSTDLFIVSMHLMGISSIMSAINIIVTIMNLRVPSMTYQNMPIFCWTWLVSAFLMVMVMPVLAAAVTMLLADRHFGTHFFNAAGGGDPVLYQHIFWFFGHPEVYIMILPAFGIISEIIPTFARKPLFGRSSMIIAILGIAVLSFLVWAHHMFTTGLPLEGTLFFMYATMIISVPTGIKVFNWIATLYQGSITFEMPMRFALAFVALFVVGGLSGIMLSVVPADFQYHDSYFVVAHFHYVLFPGTVFALMAAIYYWLPHWTGVWYNELLAECHFWLTLIATNLTFFPMHFLGLAGMPRRISDYALQFADFNRFITAGALLLGLSQLIFVYIVWQCMRGKGRPVEGLLWDGARGLEWSLPSPVPHHSFSGPADQVVCDPQPHD